MAAQHSRPRDPSCSSALEGAALQARICAVIDRALSVRIADFEDAARHETEALRAQARDILRECLEVIALVHDYGEEDARLRASEPPAPDPRRTFCQTVELHDRRPSGLEKIGDLAFVAAMGLRNRMASVRAVATAEDTWAVIAECSGAIREVLKSLSAIERAICEHASLPQRSSYFVSELERALGTRRAYVRLRNDVVGMDAPVGEQVSSRLRIAAAAIAKLVSRDIYISARVHDRRLIRQAQQRIRGWLASEPATAGRAREGWLRDGERIYRDLANVCDLVLAINHRAELCAHDAAVLESALETLRAHAPGPLTICAELPALLLVAGRDAELDALLRAASADAEEVAAVVERSLRALRGR